LVIGRGGFTDNPDSTNKLNKPAPSTRKRKKEEGRRKKEEGRRKKGRKEEGRRKKGNTIIN
jgi:hypothetical protein